MLKIIRVYGLMLLKSMGNTLLLCALSLLAAMIIGLVVALFNVGKKRILNLFGTVFVDAIRGVPLIVLAYFVYFGIPQAAKMLGFSGLRLSALSAGIITLSMNCGAYMAEIIRAGIESVDKGQMEASRSLGLSYGKSMRLVVIPQAIKTMIPSIIYQFIINLIYTSILSFIVFPELFITGKNVAGNTFLNLQVWAIVGVMYMVVIITLSKVAKKLERRLKRGEL